MSLMIPSSFASSKEKVFPVTISSIALLLPTMRESRCVPPVPGSTPRFTSGSPILPASCRAIRMSAAMAISNPPPTQCPFRAAITSLGVLTEVVLECRIDACLYFDIRARREKLVPCPGKHNHVYIVVHPRLENRLIQLPVHLVGISIRRRVAKFYHRHAGIDAVVDQLFGSLAACWLYCSRHAQTPFRNRQKFRLSSRIQISSCATHWPRWRQCPARKYLPFRVPVLWHWHRLGGYTRCKSSSSSQTD